jgi:hypothetical protein
MILTARNNFTSNSPIGVAMSAFSIISICIKCKACTNQEVLQLQLNKVGDCGDVLTPLWWRAKSEISPEKSLPQNIWLVEVLICKFPLFFKKKKGLDQLSISSGQRWHEIKAVMRTLAGDGLSLMIAPFSLNIGPPTMKQSSTQNWMITSLSNILEK